MTAASTGSHHVEHVMGVAVSIDIRDATTSSEPIDEVVAWLHHVDRTFSTYDPTTPISRLGLGEVSLTDTTDEIRDVLSSCERLRSETGRIFDVFEVPPPNGTTLDPSGYVKGWAVEIAATILEELGCIDFCINAGGDVVIRGHSSGSEPWRVGVRHPDIESALALVIATEGPAAIATSALYERGLHIIDPRSGHPAMGLSSVTIVGPDLGVADAYATTVFVMGRDGLDWIEDKPGYEAYLITNDNDTRWTQGFNRYRARDGEPL